MILTDVKIKKRIDSEGLLSNHDLASIKNCGYTLCIGKVFQPQTGKEEILNTPVGNTVARVWQIGPSETLVIRTREKVKMPKDLCAIYTPLHSLSRQGLMLINASIVEPGYEGYLSCFLVNFSSKPITLKQDDLISKITFHQLSEPPGDLAPLSIEDNKYEEMLSEMAMRFDKSFMDITGIEDRAVQKARDAVKRWVIIGGVLVAFLLLWAQMEPLLSKWLWQKPGIYTGTQRTEDVRLLKDIEIAQLKLANEQVKQKRDLEIAQLKAEIEKISSALQDLKAEKEQ